MPTATLNGTVDTSTGATVVVELVVEPAVVVVGAAVAVGVVVLLLVVVVEEGAGLTVEPVVDGLLVVGDSDAPAHADNTRATVRMIALATRDVDFMRTPSLPHPLACEG